MSVTDKTGLVEFAKALVETGEWEIVSTGGTARALKEGGVPCILVEDVTGFPEMMDGRLKTLHPKVFGGILADRSKESHLEAAARHGIAPIDMVVVNLYNFAGNPSVEQIDIGGPALIRAAAKNFRHIIVIVDPADYLTISWRIKENVDIADSMRHQLAKKAFRSTAAYDSAIAEEFARCAVIGTLMPLGTH